jgi:hypothetical protein
MTTESLPAARPRGDVYEGLAFTFCKTATVCLLAQQFALPLAAGLAAVFFVLAHVHGRRETRCVARVPLLIAALWAAVCVGWIWIRVTH